MASVPVPGGSSAARGDVRRPPGPAGRKPLADSPATCEAWPAVPTVSRGRQRCSLHHAMTPSSSRSSVPTGSYPSIRRAFPMFATE
jgi:hypothetical protein